MVFPPYVRVDVSSSPESIGKSFYKDRKIPVFHRYESARESQVVGGCKTSWYSASTQLFSVFAELLRAFVNARGDCPSV